MNNTKTFFANPVSMSPELSADVRRLLTVDAPRLRRLWGYYRNTIRNEELVSDSSTDRPYRQAQEWGMPSRITGVIAGRELFESTDAGDVQRKEVVIENDIGWRIDTMVDFLFGKPIIINSEATDINRRTIIEELLREIIAQNGGIVFLQQLAVLGAVYGSVDVLVKLLPFDANHSVTNSLSQSRPVGDVKIDPSTTDDPTSAVPQPSDQQIADESVPPPLTESSFNDAANTGPSHPSPGDIVRLARLVRLEIVEPARALPLLDPADCTSATSFATVYQFLRNENIKSVKPRWLEQLWGKQTPSNPNYRTVVELITPTSWKKYEDNQLIASGINTLNRLPLVHIQNMPNPLQFAGHSDVEPLMPVQDELNTRLSDRAHRITLTSLKMYLGKGIDNFTSLPIAPGQMWSTDNLEANVIEFGGDTNNPGEDTHIGEVREALDKISGVSPVAAGAIKGRIGHLTSALALRVTMQALVSRTERKRTTYGLGISQMCELALAWLDSAGLFHTDESERSITIHWPNPVPANEQERLDEAKSKIAIGIPPDVVLRELGYEIPPK